MATLYTDGDGKVDYNVDNLDENYMYYAEAYKNTYFDTHNNQVSVTRGKKNFSTTIYIYAESYVKLHVKNVNPFNQLDLINIKSTCNSFDLQGMNIDTLFTWCDYCDCKWMGNFDYEASLGIIKNDTQSKIVFSFTPSPHDSITVNINY